MFYSITKDFTASAPASAATAAVATDTLQDRLCFLQWYTSIMICSCLYLK